MQFIRFLFHSFVHYFRQGGYVFTLFVC